MDNKEIRASILKRLYDFHQKEPYNILELQDFQLKVPENLLLGNLRYLNEKSLIEFKLDMGGHSGYARITAFGIDVVENPEQFEGQFSINFNLIQVGGDVNAPIVQGHQIDIVSSFNKLTKIVEERRDIGEEEKGEILEKLGELREVLSSEQLNKSQLEKLEKFLSKYGWLFPMVLKAIRKALGL
ncbi:MAG: hypothetical protein ACTSPG_10325 [Candidatus Hodarchaeales archaeon]